MYEASSIARGSAARLPNDLSFSCRQRRAAQAGGSITLIARPRQPACTSAYDFICDVLGFSVRTSASHARKNVMAWSKY